MSKIAIITRMNTENAGNEALSAALIKYVHARAPKADVRGLDRFPTYFRNIRLADFGISPKEIEARLDSLAKGIIAKFKPTASGTLAPVADETKIELRERPKLRRKTVSKLRAALSIRGRLAKLGLLDREENQVALNTLAWAELVIWNPAGEFHPTGNLDEGARLLLMMRVAQLLGAKIAVVNHSLENTDERLNHLISLVYRDAVFVSVREKGSYAEAIRLGVPAERVVEAPDLVFTLQPAEPPTTGKDGENKRPIALSINGLEAFKGTDEWEEFFSALKGFGRPLVFVSNCMNDDIPFIQNYADRYGITYAREQHGYKSLQSDFKDAELLVSSRLHAAVLSLSCGTPVVSMEPQLFKLTGIFQQLSYPIPTEKIDNTGWAKRLLVKIEQGLADREAISIAGLAGIEKQTAHIDRAYDKLFAVAGG